MSLRKEIFKDATIYSLTSYGAQFFDIINGIFLRRFLGPANMGIWAFLQVVQNYARHAGLGVTSATSRDVPYYLGKGDKAKAEQVQNLVFSFSTATALMASIGVMIFAWIKKGQYSAPIFYGLFVVAAIILLQRLYNLYVVLLRSYKEFVFAGFLNIASAIVTLACTFIFVWKWKLYGFYAGLILHYVLMLVLIYFKVPYRFSFVWGWTDLKPLLNLGSAIVIADVLKTVLTSIDRIMIAKYLGFTELGYYSIALMANNYLYALPNMLGIIFFPHFQEAFAKKDDKADLKKYLEIPTLGIALLFPFLIGFVWTSSSWIIPVILPQYASGITALRYLILGSFFMALTHSFSNYIITVRRHWHLIPLQAVSVVFGFTASWLMLKLGQGIEGIAIAMMLIYLLQFLILSYISLSDIHDPKHISEFYLKIFWVFGYMVSALFAVHYLFRGWGDGPLKFFAEFSLFCLTISPFLFWAEKEAGVVTTLRHVCADWFSPRKTKSKVFPSAEKSHRDA